MSVLHLPLSDLPYRNKEAAFHCPLSGNKITELFLSPDNSGMFLPHERRCNPETPQYFRVSAISFSRYEECNFPKHNKPTSL